MRKAQGFGSLFHLATRFFGSVVPVGPRKAAQGWAISQLLPGEAALFAAMSGADRRHAIGVARRAIDLLGGSSGGHAGSSGAPGGGTASRAFVAAGLLHDVGKTESRLGTFARVAATVLAGLIGREKVVEWGLADAASGTAAAAVPAANGVTRVSPGGRRSESRRAPGRSWLSIRDWQARMGQYLMHDRIGGQLLEEAGSEMLTSTWAREHHLPESRWSVEPHLGHALKEADGD